jgi:transposase
VLRNGKRMYVHEFKLGLVRRCMEPGVSVSAVALEHGINTNLLRKWIDKHRDQAGANRTPALLPVMITTPQPAAAVTPSPREVDSAIEIEIFGARLTLHGDIDPRRLRLVLDALSRRT